MKVRKFSIFALLVGLIGLLSFGLSRSSLPQPALEPFKVEISSSLASSNRWLTSGEKEEQLRDWLVYAAVQVLNVPVEDAVIALYDKPPWRRSTLAPASSYAFGKGRWAALGDDLLAIAPQGVEGQLLEGMVDEYRMRTRRKPRRVYLFEYAIDPEAMSATLIPKGEIDGGEFFKKEHGYYEFRSHDAGDLRAFLNRGLDLVYAYRRPDGTLELGGREREKVLDLEDVAALYQAYQRRLNLSHELHDLYSQAEEWKRELLEEWGIGEEELDRLLNPSPGFSLDPFNPELYDWFLSLTPPGLPEERWKGFCQALGRGEFARAIVETVLYWGSTEDLLWPLLSLMGGLYFQPDCQCARYDGWIQGTKAAMTLYYCDLLAKLWAFDYQDSAPRGIGMVPIPKIPISSIYWEYIWNYPWSRLWFGPCWEGLGHGPQTLFFGPLGTRLYAASSEEEERGEEVEPNPPTARFIEWWESHWSKIMRYEPQYQRLNQLMKWSTLIAWLELKGSQALAFLEGEDVDRSQNFIDWFEKHRRELKFHKDLPFLDAPDMECLELIRSRSFLAGGKKAHLEGGVTLTTLEESKEMLSGGQLPSDIWEELSRIRRSGNGRIKPLSGVTYIFELPKVKAIPPAPLSGVRFSGRWVEIRNEESLELDFDRETNIFKVRLKLGEQPLGEFSVTREGQKLLVDYEPTALSIAQDVVEILARDFTPELLEEKHPLLRLIASRRDFKAAFELDDGSLLLKTRAGEWIWAGENIDGPIRSGINDKVSLELHNFAAELVKEDDARALLGEEAIELEDYLTAKVSPFLFREEAAIALSPKRVTLVRRDGEVLSFPFDIEALRSQEAGALADQLSDPSRPKPEFLDSLEGFLGLLEELSGERIRTIFIGATEGLAPEYGAIDQFVKVMRWIDPGSRWAHLRVVYDQPRIDETAESFEEILSPTLESTVVFAHGCGELREILDLVEEAGVKVLMDPGPQDYKEAFGNPRYNYFIVIAPQPENTPLYEDPGLLEGITSQHIAISFLIPWGWELTFNAIGFPQVELVLYSVGELRLADAVEVVHREVEKLAAEKELYEAAMGAWEETIKAHPEIEDWERIFEEYLKIRAKA